MLLMRINFRSSTITSTTNSKLLAIKTEGSAFDPLRLQLWQAWSTGLHNHDQWRPLQRLLSLLVHHRAVA